MQIREGLISGAFQIVDQTIVSSSCASVDVTTAFNQKQNVMQLELSKTFTEWMNGALKYVHKNRVHRMYAVLKIVKMVHNKCVVSFISITIEI